MPLITVVSVLHTLVTLKQIVSSSLRLQENVTCIPIIKMMRPSLSMLQGISINTIISYDLAKQNEYPGFVSPTISQGVGRTEFLRVYPTIAVTLIWKCDFSQNKDC